MTLTEARTVRSMGKATCGDSFDIAIESANIAPGKPWEQGAHILTFLSKDNDETKDRSFLDSKAARDFCLSFLN